MFNASPSTPYNETKDVPFGRAVVIGGSVAGLTTAKILADHFATVTIIERSPMANVIKTNLTLRFAKT